MIFEGRSEGQRLLAKVLKSCNQVELARKCAVGQPTVSYWLSGKGRPGYENRVVLQTKYRIPMDAWDKPAENEDAHAASRPSQRSRLSAVKAEAGA